MKVSVVRSSVRRPSTFSKTSPLSREANSFHIPHIASIGEFDGCWGGKKGRFS